MVNIKARDITVGRDMRVTETTGGPMPTPQSIPFHQPPPEHQREAAGFPLGGLVIPLALAVVALSLIAAVLRPDRAGEIVDALLNIIKHIH